MTVESATYISQLDTTLPTAADLISEGDDHLRLTKAVLKTQFPNFGTTAIAASAVEVNYSVGVTSAIQPQLNAKANSASPTFTGTVVLPATTSIGSISAAEIARLAGVTFPIQGQIDARGVISGQVWAGAHDFTGATPTVPTATPGDSSSKAASTAFVVGTAFSAALPGQTGNANKFVKTNGTSASWAYPILPFNDMAASGTALVGFNNRITAGGITVTLPALADGEVCEITNVSNTITPVVDWGAVKFRGQASPGLMTLNNLSARLHLTGTGNATIGNV